MQHLVKQDVLDDVARDSGMVEDAADDNRVVGGIIVAQAIAGVVAAPGELGASHQAVEEAVIEVLEKLVEIEIVSTGGVDVFASTHLAYQAGLGGDVVACRIAAVACALGAIYWTAVQLRQEDVRDCVKHGFGRGFQQIRKADVEFSLPQADGVIDRDERVEANVHRGDGRTRAQVAVGGVEDLLQLGGHGFGRVAWGSCQWSVASCQFLAVGSPFSAMCLLVCPH